MWILLLPIIIAEILFWLGLIFVAWRAYRAWSEGATGTTAVWLAVLAAPFLFYQAQLALADMRESERAEEVSTFARHPLPRSYPRRLEIEGYITEHERLIYLDTLAIGDIVMFQSRPHRGQRRAEIVKLAPGCRGRGRRLLADWRARRKLGNTKTSAACLISKRTTLPTDTGRDPAIRFLSGHYTTLSLPGTRWSSGNYEARLRTRSGDILLDYWERPYIERPSWPGPWGYVYRGNTDWKDYRSPARIDFFGRAVGLIPREDSKTSRS